MSVFSRMRVFLSPMVGHPLGAIGRSFLEMVRARVSGIMAAYEDQNDHDTLRFRTTNIENFLPKPGLAFSNLGTNAGMVCLDRTLCAFFPKDGRFGAITMTLPQDFPICSEQLIQASNPYLRLGARLDPCGVDSPCAPLLCVGIKVAFSIGPR